ncbi:hypothetical protein Goari_003441 [Gossypium aridum]|uniref:Uncharacterized protein n=1 Tax=Gossypium aridum TaxID=34290 RepID=A0A7J8YD16_GOSAI|nr:hypothetical protein [Gossypium aridum]
MEKRFLDKVEDNAAIRIWFEKTQQEKGDSLTEGLVIFPKVLGHVDDIVSDLFDRHNKRVTLVLVEKVSYRVFFEDYSPLKKFIAILR